MSSNKDVGARPGWGERHTSWKDVEFERMQALIDKVWEKTRKKESGEKLTDINRVGSEKHLEGMKSDRKDSDNKKHERRESEGSLRDSSSEKILPPQKDHSRKNSDPQESIISAGGIRRVDGKSIINKIVEKIEEENLSFAKKKEMKKDRGSTKKDLERILPSEAANNAKKTITPFKQQPVSKRSVSPILVQTTITPRGNLKSTIPSSAKQKEKKSDIAVVTVSATKEDIYKSTTPVGSQSKNQKFFKSARAQEAEKVIKRAPESLRKKGTPFCFKK